MRMQSRPAIRVVEGAAMPLSEKVARSGLDLSGRRRPTLAVLPRGNWIRHYAYDFFACGHVLDSLTLDSRQWTCPECGSIHDRDVNAARNIFAVKESAVSSRVR